MSQSAFYQHNLKFLRDLYCSLFRTQKMYPFILSKSLLQLRQILSTKGMSIHTNVASFAAVKKTTSAAGGVMGLGKGKKKQAGKLGAMEKKELPVETDPVKLVNFVCGSNIYTTGEDVQIKPDSEYPDWLWQLNTEAPPRIDDLDPSTKQYWLRVRAAGMRRNNKLRSMRKF